MQLKYINLKGLNFFCGVQLAKFCDNIHRRQSQNALRSSLGFETDLVSLPLSIMSLSAYELSVDLCRVYVWYLFLYSCLCVCVRAACALLKEVMSSLRPSYCKKSSNGITSACGTPTEHSVIQNSCRWNQIHPAVLLPVLFPNGFYLGTFPLEIRMRHLSMSWVFWTRWHCRLLADLVLQCLNILQSHLLTCLSLSDCKIVDSRIYSAVRSAYSVQATAAVMTPLLLMRRHIQHTQSLLHKVLLGNLMENISGSCCTPLSKEKNIRLYFAKRKSSLFIKNNCTVILFYDSLTFSL